MGGEAQVQAFEPLKKSNGSPLRLCLNALEPHSLTGSEGVLSNDSCRSENCSREMV